MKRNQAKNLKVWDLEIECETSVHKSLQLILEDSLFPNKACVWEMHLKQWCKSPSFIHSHHLFPFNNV